MLVTAENTYLGFLEDFQNFHLNARNTKVATQEILEVVERTLRKMNRREMGTC